MFTSGTTIALFFAGTALGAAIAAIVFLIFGETEEEDDVER